MRCTAELVSNRSERTNSCSNKPCCAAALNAPTMAPPTSSSLRQKYPHQIIMPATSHLPTYPPPTAHPVLQFCRILWSPCLILPCCFVAWCALRGWNTWPHAVQGTSLCCCCWLLLLLPVVVLVGCHDDAQKERIEQGQKQGKANLLPQLSLFFLSR